MVKTKENDWNSVSVWLCKLLLVTYVYIYICYIFNYIYTSESNYFYSHEMVGKSHPIKWNLTGTLFGRQRRKRSKPSGSRSFKENHRRKNTHSYIYICIYIHSVVVEQKHKMCLTQMPFIYQESVTLDVNVYLPIQNTLPKWGNVEALWTIWGKSQFKFPHQTWRFPSPKLLQLWRSPMITPMA